MVRKFLLWTMLLLVVVAGVIAIAAAVCGKPEAILIAVVPALPIFPLLLVYLLLAAFSANKERHQGMADAAERLGFLYTADASNSLLEESDGFSLVAGRTQLSDEIRGEQDGVSVVVFTCSIRYGNGNYRYATAALLPLHATSVPDFVLAPKTVVDRLCGALGGQSIEFNETQRSEAFSRQFAVWPRGDSSEDELHAFFDESRMASFSKHNPVCVEVAGGSLMVRHEVGIREGLHHSFRSIRVNVADEAVAVFRRAMEIRAALLK